MTQETSKTAYIEEILPTLADRHRKVLKALAGLPDASNNELAHILGWTINTVTPRINELVGKKLVEEHVKRPCRITGRKVIAWRIRPKVNNLF